MMPTTAKVSETSVVWVKTGKPIWSLKTENKYRIYTENRTNSFYSILHMFLV